MSSNRNCTFNVKTFGQCDVSKVLINGADRTTLNWNQMSIPEILTIPEVKPDVETLDQIYVNADITSIKLIETPFSYTQMQNDRVLTADELLAALAAVDLAVIDPTLITAITTSVNAILAVPGLNAVPGVGPLITDIQNALSAVTQGATNVTAAIGNANTVLVDGVVISDAVDSLDSLRLSLVALQSGLEGLLSSVNALASFVSSVPIVGPAVAALIGAVTTAVQDVLDIVITALLAITDIINQLLSSTTYFKLNENAEGTILTGRKLIIEGVLRQKVVYTADVDVQSVHSAHFEVPFVSFIIPYAKFEGLTYDPEINGFYFDPAQPIVPDLAEEFNVTPYIEDVYACLLNERTVFKNVTLLLYARSASLCN